MKRQIIHIDQEKCTGCGLCAQACHEGAIGMVNGKATLLRDDYCDGMGDCLPSCPAGAITFTQKDTAAYDEKAVAEHKAQRAEQMSATITGAAQGDERLTPLLKKLPCGCPGNAMKTFNRDTLNANAMHETEGNEAQCAGGEGAQYVAPVTSQLRQWPVQIKLVPVNAPYFDGANLLVAADCTAYAYGNFHNEFIKNRITLIGCPKLDEGDYTEKLSAIIAENNIKSLTVVRMEVPCCGGLERAAVTALQNSGKFIPWRVVTISTDGRILDE